MGAKRKRGAKGHPPTDQPSQKKSRNGEVPPALAPAPSLDLDTAPFLEKLSGEERKREAKLYDLLGNFDSAVHIAAAGALITGLLSSEEVVLERHLEKRLFRGLASSRNASRVGFSLVLTEILSQLYGAQNLVESKFPGLTFERVLEILLEKTQPAGNLPGQEERDYYFGQLFGLQCFVEANILFSGSSTKWPAVLELLVKLAQKKAWLRSHAVWVIVQALPDMGQKLAGQTLETLVDHGIGKTAEGVGVWLKAADCYPELKIPSKPWSDPLAPKSLPELANVLKENVKQDDGSRENAGSNVAPSNWNSQLHFVWDLILAYFTADTRTGKTKDTEHFKLFWNTVVDDGLFSKNATEAQKFRGFMIFQKFLNGFTAKKATKHIQSLFSRNLMKCLLNQAAKEDRYVHRAAIKSLKTVVEAVEAEKNLLVPTLTELLGKHGVYDFDQRTNTKTIEKLLQHTTPQGAESVFALIRQPAISIHGGDVIEAEKIRHVYADYLVKICTPEKGLIGAVGHDYNKGTIIETAVKEMASCAYSNEDSSFEPQLSDKTREYYRNRLESAFAKLTKQREDYRYLCNAVSSIEPSAVNMSTEIHVERKAALKSLRKLVKYSAKSDSGDNSSLGLALLYAITILQLYNGEADALSTLADLKQCSDGIKEAEDAASALLVEILLSLVSRPSPMMRQITQQVFEAFTPYFTTDALSRLTEPLIAEENLKGQQALFDAGDEDMLDVNDLGDSGSDDDDQDGDVDENISEIGSDVEFVTLNGAGDEGGTESDEDAEDDNNADAQELADLDEKIATILGSHRLDKDKDAESSDNDSDMTDSEMMALDEKLVEVFRQRQKPNKKKESKDAKETMVVFKHRILDFIDIYVKKEAHNNPLTFSLLLPLLNLIRTTSTKELAGKGMKVITDFSDAYKKGRNKSNSSNSITLELLKEILQEAPRDQSHMFARAVSTSSLIGASSLASAGKAKDAWDTYAKTVEGWLEDESVKIQPAVISDWANWLQSNLSGR